MRKLVSLESYVKIWTTEALQLHGDNWDKIADFIQLRMKELPQDTRMHLEQSAVLALAAQQPKSKRRSYH